MKIIFFLFLMILFNLKTETVFAQSSAPITQIAFITATNTNGKFFIIKADFVQMLTGQNAVKAAKRAGEAEYDISKNGDTAWYVPNDYFVLNSNSAIRQLRISPTAQIYLIKEGGSAIFKSSLSKLKNNFTGKLFRLFLRNNEIIKLEEIFTP